MGGGRRQGKGVALRGDGPHKRQRIGGGDGLLVHPIQVLAELESHAARRADRGIVDVGIHVDHAHAALAGSLGDAQPEGRLAGVDAAEQHDAAAGDQALDDLGV